MNSFPPSDVSLYELVVNAAAPPQPMQLSPTTFKSIVGLFLDFLVEQHLPASIWLKLPRGEAWQAEVDRFCQFATAAYSIHSLQTYQKPVPPSPADADLAQPVDSNLASSWSKPIQVPDTVQTEPSIQTELDEIDDLSLDDAPDSGWPIDSSRLHILPLAADSQLKREYFLLIVAPSFYALILAHRPRSVRGLQEGKLVGSEDALERKHPLLGICSFDPIIIQQVLEEGVNMAICFGQPDAASSDLKELLVSWKDVTQDKPVRLDPTLVGQLFVKQVQKQEDLWRSTTAQRRQAEALPTLQQDNEALLNALHSKDEFIKTMGLELRTPLSTMKTAMSLLNSPSIKPQQRQRYMEMLSRECDRQSSLISGVLDLVQLESSDEETPMEPLRLSDLVPGVVSTYQPLAQEKGVMLGYVVPEDLPPVSCLTPWLKQIVINLLHNSIKFTPQGGQVWVRARQQGHAIQIEFRDTGIGIASSDLPRIFDRFYRVRGNSIENGGIGLGLSIVQQLLLRCGGSISVKSKQGEGSAFTVLLPIY